MIRQRGWGKGAHPGKTCLAFLAGLRSLASLEEVLASDSAPHSGAEPASAISASFVHCSAADGPSSVFMSAERPCSRTPDSPEACKSLSAPLSTGLPAPVGAFATARALRPCSAKEGKRAEMGPLAADGEPRKLPVTAATQSQLLKVFPQAPMFAFPGALLVEPDAILYAHQQMFTQQRPRKVSLCHC